MFVKVLEEGQAEVLHEIRQDMLYLEVRKLKYNTHAQDLSQQGRQSPSLLGEQ